MRFRCLSSSRHFQHFDSSRKDWCRQSTKCPSSHSTFNLPVSPKIALTLRLRDLSLGWCCLTWLSIWAIFLQTLQAAPFLIDAPVIENSWPFSHFITNLLVASRLVYVELFKICQLFCFIYSNSTMKMRWKRNLGGLYYFEVIYQPIALREGFASSN